jgi:hypothetical protein
MMRRAGIRTSGCDDINRQLMKSLSTLFSDPNQSFGYAIPFSQILGHGEFDPNLPVLGSS